LALILSGLVSRRRIMDARREERRLGLRHLGVELESDLDRVADAEPTSGSTTLKVPIEMDRETPTWARRAP